MANDREEDILYLAHQLWEEDAAPAASAHTYWQEAARQVLASGQKPYGAFGRGVTSCYDTTGKAVTRLTQLSLQFGTTSRIEMGIAVGTQRVTLFNRQMHLKAANSAALIMDKSY